jgi:hypothetical protein
MGGHGGEMAVTPAAPVLDDRYEIGDLIGRGSMGEVRRGWDRRLDRPVAVKCLRRDLAADAGVRARFEEEARAAGALAHPAIVTVFDTGESDGTPFIVMECLPGNTLADDIATGPLPADEVRAMGIELAGALAAAHAAGTLHRDVKPANVLRTESGAVKLADFGIAKSAESAGSLTVTGTVLGSPAYLAPERLHGAPASEASDVYALAVVLYEALTGACPFRGDTPMVVAHAVTTTDPEPLADRLPDLDPTMAEAIDRAMAKDPDVRPASAAAFADLLVGAPAPAVELEPPRSGDTQVIPIATTATTVIATADPIDDEPAAAPTVRPAAAPMTAATSRPAPGAAPFIAVATAPIRRWGWGPVAAVAAVVLVLLLAWSSTRGDDIVVPAGATTDTTAATVPPTTVAPTTTVAPAPAPTEAPAPAGGGGGGGNGNGHGRGNKDH